MPNGEFEAGEFLNAAALHQSLMAIWSDKDVICEIPEHVSKRGHNLSIYSRAGSLKALVSDGGLPSDTEMRTMYLSAVQWVQEKMLVPLEMDEMLKGEGHYDLPPAGDLCSIVSEGQCGSDDEDQQGLDIDAPDTNAIDARAENHRSIATASAINDEEEDDQDDETIIES